jgi:HEAT repeats
VTATTHPFSSGKGKDVVRCRLTLFGLALLAAGCSREKVPAELYFSGEPVSHWVEAAKSPDPKVRKKAVDVLGNVGPADPAAIPALIVAVKDKDAGVRDAAVLALSKIGPPAADALPTLREAMKDPNPTIRAHATTAVDRVAGSS